MSGELAAFVNTAVVPIGLMAIMFSMGLSLSLRDFAEVAVNPRAVFAGLFGQLCLLPPLAIGVITLFQLPPEMAVGLFILAVCPGGVTSNAVTYAAKANVALAVVLTTLSSLVTVFSVPVLVGWALQFYYVQGDAPAMSVPQTMMQLARITLVPVLLGMAIRGLRKSLADRLTIYLRPASLIVLIAVIAFSLYASADLVLQNLLRAGPAAYVLNLLSVVVGVLLAWLLRLERRDVLTVGIEVGIHNATLATFLSLTILNNLALAITPTIYGCIMVLNAFLLVGAFRWLGERGSLRKSDVSQVTS